MSNLAWNKKIEKILASAGQNGQVVFWDAMATKEIFQLGGEDTDSPRHISLAWNPFIPTQIALASDDDFKKEIQIWDLRNTRGPILRIGKGFSRGITSLDWSSLDHNLLLAATKENKIVCWDLGSDCQVISDCAVPDTVHNIRWNRKAPSVFLASSPSANEVFCLSEKDLHSYAPQWYKPTVCFTTDLCHTTYSYTTASHSLLREEPEAAPGNLREQVTLIENIMEKEQFDPQLDFCQALLLAQEDTGKIF